MLIYKVSPPRENLVFEPSVFYRTADFKSSSTRPKPGYAWKDDSARRFATERGALLAGKRGDKFSLSPGSLRELPAGARLVLPSPNGATLSLAAAGRPTMCGCLRNAAAVAKAAGSYGPRVAVIPAGERWPDDTLRPCFEDWIGAGAIIEQLPGTRSPEAEAALAAWQSARLKLLELLRVCPSGQELIERGFPQDVEIAGEVNVSLSAPTMKEGAYVDGTLPAPFVQARQNQTGHSHP